MTNAFLEVSNTLCDRHERPAEAPVPAAPVRSGRILIVDDEPINVRVVRRYLALAGYEDFLTATDPTLVLELIDREAPDVVILDIMMPRISGLELLERLRANPTHSHLPILILTAVDDRDTKVRALSLGATDFLTKPVDPTELAPRVRNALLVKAHHDHLRNHAQELERQVEQRTADLEASRLQVIQCLARAAEYRDDDTGRHVVRVGRYVGVMASQLGFATQRVALLELASLLHDIGKIAMPDEILKPGNLDPADYERMQKHGGFGKGIIEPLTGCEWQAFIAHTTIGAKIVAPCRSPLLELAGSIALTHHERWDGTGYPTGLAGEAIPIEGRITAVADVLDALTSHRAYKQALPLDRAFEILENERRTAFDPRVLDALFDRREDILRIQRECADVDLTLCPND